VTRHPSLSSQSTDRGDLKRVTQAWIPRR
jgi:hypothetical protein